VVSQEGIAQVGRAAPRLCAFDISGSFHRQHTCTLHVSMSVAVTCAPDQFLRPPRRCWDGTASEPVAGLHVTVFATAEWCENRAAGQRFALLSEDNQASGRCESRTSRTAPGSSHRTGIGGL
jgi:hypothetical protein